MSRCQTSTLMKSSWNGLWYQKCQVKEQSTLSLAQTKKASSRSKEDTMTSIAFWISCTNDGRESCSPPYLQSLGEASASWRRTRRMPASTPSVNTWCSGSYASCARWSSSSKVKNASCLFMQRIKRMSAARLRNYQSFKFRRHTCAWLSLATYQCLSTMKLRLEKWTMRLQII